jgi:hypothetical protein
MADSEAAEVVPPVADAAVEQSVSTAVASRAGRTIKLTSEQEALALIGLVQDGVSVREAASQLGLNLRTAFGVLARSTEDIDATRAAIRRVMAAQALDRMEDWRIASEVGARKKGNHAPARDWLLHAGVIDQLDSDSTSVRISINIGTDAKPMRIPSPLAQQDSDD